MKLHPDKNKEGRDEFIKITNAYKALTNEEARKNYELYGNIDGFVKYDVSIALPEGLVNPNNKKMVLYIYAAFVIIFVPLLAFYCYQQTRYYNGDEKIFMETTRLYYKNINDDTNIQYNLIINSLLIDVLCLSDEFVETDLISINKKEIPHLKELYEFMKRTLMMNKPSVYILYNL